MSSLSWPARPTPAELSNPAEPAFDWVGDQPLPGPEARARLSRRWVDDQHGMLVEEARGIMRGRINSVLTDQHVQALCEANRQAAEVRQWAANQTGKSPF